MTGVPDRNPTDALLAELQQRPEDTGRALEERREREHRYYPTLKRFDGLAEAYVSAMGGEQAYARFIRRINPNAPVFNPDADDPYRSATNCYDYGMNDLDRVGTASNPGGVKQQGQTARGFGRFVDAVMLGVQQDGAHYIPPAELARWADQGLRNDHYLMAMYVRPYMLGDKPEAGAVYDYHFVRQDSQGGFSHKRGPLRASNDDNDHKFIADPLAANLGNYVFVGFFAVPRNGLDVGDGPRHARVNGHTLPIEQRRALDARLLSETSLTPLAVSSALADERARAAVPPLLLAVDRGDQLAVEAFIAAGANINVQGNLINDYGTAFSMVSYRAEHVSPLMWAVQRRERDMVATLLSAGADTSLLDRNGWSALEYASGEAFGQEPDTSNEIYQLLKAQPGNWGKRLASVGEFFESLKDSSEIDELKAQLQPMLPFVQGHRFWDKDDSGLIDADELAHVLAANGITRIEDVNRDSVTDAQDLVQQWNAQMSQRPPRSRE